MVQFLFAVGLWTSLPGAAQVGVPDYEPVGINQTEEATFPRSLVNVGIKSGAASIAVAVDADGRVTDYLVTAYSHPAFADSAVAAMKKWIFRPAEIHGERRNSKVDLTFRFELEGVVVVTLTPISYSELVRFKIAPNSMAYSACTLRQLDRIPTPKKIVNPIYPAQLARSSRGGHVSVEFYIDEAGHVRIPSVSKETDEANEELAAIAVTAVSQWEFEPPLSGGKPVVVKAKQDFDFKPAPPPGNAAPSKPQTRLENPFESKALPFVNPPAASTPVETQGYTIVSAHAYEGYVRETQEDGSYRPETYAFGNGTRWDIGMSDPTMDDLNFEQVAQTIAPSLAAQNYVPGKAPENTNLLIVVYWGTTSGSAEAPGYQMPYYSSGIHGPAQSVSAPSAMGILPISGSLGTMVDIRNARMLGFDFPNESSPFKFDDLSLLQEIEANRYFVGLVAYDFQLLWTKNIRKVLWVTRYSIREHRNEFDRDLPQITKYASQFFGRESRGFVVKRLREGHVDVGPVTTVDSGDAK